MSTSKGSILITGANGGIGMGIVEEFLKSSYAITHQGVYIVRDPTKAFALQASLKNAPKDHHHQTLALDLESLASVRALAAEVNKQVADGSLAPIQALVLNAGLQDVKGQIFTKDGMERTFEVNYLSNFLLGLLLLQSMDKKHARIVKLLISRANRDYYYDPREYVKRIEEHPDHDPFKTGMRAYAISKLLCMEWMYELQRRLDADPELSNISVLGMDPGWVAATGIFRHQLRAVQIFMSIMRMLAPVITLFSSNPLFRTPSKNGKDMLRVCFDKKAFGEYPKAIYVDGSVLIHTPEYANDEAKQKELWEGSLKLANVKDGDTLLKDWR